MTALNVGDRVVSVARKPGWPTPAPEGTRGVITVAEPASIYPFTVAFDGGLVTPVRAGDIALDESVAHSP